MKKDVFSENGARDRPSLSAKEKLKQKSERRTAEKIRENSGIQDSSFRQAEREGGFSNRQVSFSSGEEQRESFSEKGKAAQKERVRKNYAKEMRKDAETAFRQAERNDGFSGRRETFSSGERQTKGNSKAGAAAQKDRIRRNYAKDVRKDRGVDTKVDPERRTEASGRASFSEGRADERDMFSEKVSSGERAPADLSHRRKSAFQIEKSPGEKGQFYSDAGQKMDSSFFVDRKAERQSGKWFNGPNVNGRNGSRSGKDSARRLAHSGSEAVRRTLDEATLTGEEADDVSSKTARGSYGAARLAGEGLENAAKGLRRETVKASGMEGAAGTGFSTEKAGGFGGYTAKYAGKKAFYSAEEGRAAGAAAEKTAAKELQKHLIRKNYQRAPEGTLYIPIISRIRERRRIKAAQETILSVKKASKGVAAVFAKNPILLILLLVGGVLTILIAASISGGASLVTNAVAPSSLATTFTAEDDDIRAAENDYRAMEAELNRKITDLKEQYPGYQNYGLNAGQVGHDPYKLAALLTVLHEDYTEADVQETLKRIFELQYNFSMHDEAGSVSTKKVRVGQSLGNVVTSAYCSCEICCGQWSGGPTASGVMPTPNHTIAVDAYTPTVPMGTKVIMNGIEYTVEDTGAFASYGVDFDVYYANHNEALQHGHQTWEAYIADDNGSQEVDVLVSSGSQQFTAVMANKGIDYVAGQLLDDDEKLLYDVLVETKGNKPDLFPNNIYVAAGGEGLFDYTIAGEALSDQKFANMMAEATKYLGYPYVWGGSSPSTSFDCSGFVCWVINNCGNGWNVGRTTADGLCNMLAKVSYADAKPGDIIFFAGTYDTVGASHVGIYLGDNMMIHCGEPIQYADISGSYWQQHLYCFGRLP